MRMNALAVGLAFVLSGTLFLESAAAQSAAAGQEEDVVEEINTTLRTMVIAGETFLVDTTSRLKDAEGRSISMEEIRATRNDGQGDLVEYVLSGRGDSREGSGPRSIESLRVLGGDYE